MEVTENEVSFFTKAQRHTIIKDVKITSSSFANLNEKRKKIPRTDKMFQEMENSGMFKDDDQEKLTWIVTITTETGVNEYETRTINFFTKKGAKDFADKFSIEDNLDDIIKDDSATYKFSPKKSPSDKALEMGSYSEAGRSVSMLIACRDILKFSELLLDNEISEKVINWIGLENIQRLMGEYETYWDYVAIYRYCLKHYSKSSLAFLASNAIFSYFEGEKFNSGYQFREIEMILFGAESLANSALNQRKKSGDGGGKSSSKSKDKRLNSFMSHIEKLGKHYPEISVDFIEKTAFQNAIKENKDLWIQGRNQMDGYLSKHIRSEEPYKARYDAIFNKTA
tara:strand:- start:90 stop:1106 length:1017 start_codon:yes stop_codon:yes gene_type:complete